MLKRKEGKVRKMDVRERDMDQLPPVCSLTEDQALGCRRWRSSQLSHPAGLCCTFSRVFHSVSHRAPPSWWSAAPGAWPALCLLGGQPFSPATYSHWARFTFIPREMLTFCALSPKHWHVSWQLPIFSHLFPQTWALFGSSAPPTVKPLFGCFHWRINYKILSLSPKPSWKWFLGPCKH